MVDTDSLTCMYNMETCTQLCIDLTVYWRGSVFDRVEGVLHFYEHAMQELGPSLKYYETGTMAGSKPLRKDTLDMLPTWLKGKSRRDIYMLNIESGAHPNEPSDRNFFFVADEEDDEPLGAMRLALPISYVDDPDAYIEFIRQLIKEELNFESGHAGYALNWDSRGDMTLEAMQQMSKVASRYYGVDLFDLDVTLVSMRKTKPSGIKTVGWLTLLGDNLVSRIGGEGKLAEILSKPCSIESLPHGIMVKAGERPLIGDRNRNVDLSAYKIIGRILAPYRFIDHRHFFPSISENDAMQRWLARFDE